MANVKSLTIEAPEPLEDALVALLWAHGGLGSWSEPAGSGRVRIHGFFDAGCSELGLAKALRIAGDVALSRFEPVGDRDRAATWRRASGPIEVGERFVVDPREPGEIDTELPPNGRTLLRLPARTAFGTGSHASTRLAVELLEALDVAGRAVVDVGTGSGILAFAALALGARSVVALDLDLAAALLLPAYSKLNGARPRALAGGLAALSGAARFDVALVNVVPAEIAPDLPRLAAILRPTAVAIFSGILAAEAPTALASLARHGFEARTERADGEWIAFVAARRAFAGGWESAP
ncbi:MAG: 50S ribosomal protein L11 methyltransferase [Myxococcota bacterium]